MPPLPMLASERFSWRTSRQACTNILAAAVIWSIWGAFSLMSLLGLGEATIHFSRKCFGFWLVLTGSEWGSSCWVAGLTWSFGIAVRGLCGSCLAGSSSCCACMGSSWGVCWSSSTTSLFWRSGRGMLEISGSWGRGMAVWVGFCVVGGRTSL